MASSVFYKFKSQRDESRVTFDGTGISIFDLKREIILANNLGKANDFDLVIYDKSSGQEFKDDSHIISRSSSVIVKRLPSARPGKGKAAMYIAGAGNSLPTSESVQKSGGHNTGPSTWHKGAMSRRFDGKEDPPFGVNKSSTPPVKTSTPVADDEEAAAMAAMFQAQTANWEETQEKMTHATRIYNQPRGTGFNRGGKVPTPHAPHQAAPFYQADRPLPPAYVCYRCGQKGHWIKDCPTNNDREFDNRPRIKRTTGIPRSMLKTVENPGGAELGQGVMVTQEGTYVVAQPDSLSWQKQVARPKGLTAADIRERAPTDPTLVCPIDNKLFRDAVKTPCCGTQYCEECIQTNLLERDFICPNCGKKVASLDKLIVDKPLRTKVTDYIEKMLEESRRDEEVTTGVQSSGDNLNGEQDLYSDQQPGANMDMSQMLVESIPQIQAQIQQISVMLQNPSLPNQVRQATEMQYHQLQIQLQQAQTLSAALAVATSFHQQQQQQQQQQQLQQQTQNMGGGGPVYAPPGFQNPDPRAWANNQTPVQQSGSTAQDSAYQRAPVNNRRRIVKRERPSDFLEVGGENEAKAPRYWE